jgi:hypothetical protein
MGAAYIQPGRGVTALRVSQRHVYPLLRGARARGQMEQETFHTLKHQGDNCAHHDGHGTQTLSGVLAVVMLLTFLVDQTQQ